MAIYVYMYTVLVCTCIFIHSVINPNSLDNKGSCWILKDFYCSVTMLRELGLMVYSFFKNSSPMATKGRIAEEYTKYKIHTNLYKVKKDKT